MWIESFPGRTLREAWLYLTPDEARELRGALDAWAADEPSDAAWHTQITDSDRKLTLEVSPDVGTEAFLRRFHT
ncbi:MAG: hypothetical protein M3417_06460 [Actinomycetota bacterium]|nr:hypothetical protein [Actinomycetota bacterium]